MTIVAIHQPNYVPWLGYFRKILACDTFVFFDNVQMPMGKSYVSRSAVKLPSGPHWLTVPTIKSGPLTLIKDAKIVPGPWGRKHLATLTSAYGGSRWLRPVIGLLEDALGQKHELIADLNIQIIRAISELLAPGRVKFVRASAMRHGLSNADSIVPILTELGATTYLTGSGAGSMRYLDVDKLKLLGIETRFVNNEFASYPQRHGDFLPGLSVLDALLNCGPEAVLALLNEAENVAAADMRPAS